MDEPSRRVVVALGGNAFVRPGTPLTMAAQFDYAREALRSLAPLLAPSVGLLLVHGNGPQVGHMLTRVERALGEAYAVSLEVCVAETEGELGYVLARSLHDVLAELGITRPVASVLTQVVVGSDDPAFARPTKFIGPSYDDARADVLRAGGFPVAHDVGRGWRRVVASPEPRAVVEEQVLAALLGLGVIVVAGGGGGIPVVRRGARLEGVDAVIDKDLTAALVADRVGADLLVILTGVPCAYLGFGAPGARPLGRVTPDEVRAHAREGHFPDGSMGPKMEAAARFASVVGRRAVVCDPASLSRALTGEAGTIVEAKRGGAS